MMLSLGDAAHAAAGPAQAAAAPREPRGYYVCICLYVYI